jgi:hypothetical protein
MSSEDQLAFMPIASAVSPSLDQAGVVRAAVGALGWEGQLIERIRLFGQQVAVTAAVDAQAHQLRVARGWGPVTDRMSVALWQWPEYRDTMPPTAVKLIGVLARGQRWQRVLAAAGGFVGFSSTAMLLQSKSAPNQHCLMTAHLHGVAVLHAPTTGGIEQAILLQPGRQGRVPTARDSTVSRWVEEVVYERLLADGLPTNSGTCATRRCAIEWG